MGKIYKNEEIKEKAIMVLACFDNKEDIDMTLSELKSLIKANNIEVLGSVVQKIKQPDLSYLIGKGKLDELKELIESTGANLVVFQNSLSGSKISHLEEYLNCRVIDRTMLILDIFAQRAKSNEGKIQVELAQLKYNLPRLNGISGSAGRFGGAGAGMRGPGETKIELDRRKIENQIVQKQKELNKLKLERDIRRKQRNNTYQKTVALVGYTNSGKSTLMNTISKSDVFIKDMLFATLDTTTRKVFLDLNNTILLTDTVGFVSNLPHELVDAFSATLEESLSADLLIHVVDISDPECDNKEEITKEVLKDLGVDLNKVITIYNKIDKIHKVNTKGYLEISAKNNINIDKLKNKIIEYFNKTNN
ncbi:MAG: GTPase HflX [Clostridiales bacterium]|nr:GTPase HflX [Clostridiales bacterium]